MSSAEAHHDTVLSRHKKNGTLLLLGLDNAGKTTLLHKLKTGTLTQTLPTMRPYKESLQFEHATFTMYGTGGHECARREWKTYSSEADGIVFLVDVTEKERLKESAAELTAMLIDETTQDCPIAVLANKVDGNGAASQSDIMSIFGLNGMTTGKGKIPRASLKGKRPLQLFMCSVKEGQGYGDAFRWLLEYVD